LRRRKRGEGCLLTIRLGIWGRVISSQRGPRAEPRPKMDFRLERSHLEHPFSTVEQWRGPPNVAGPGKTSRCRRAWNGSGVIGDGESSPLPPARRSGEQCKLSDTLSKLPWSGVWGGAPESLDF